MYFLFNLYLILELKSFCETRELTQGPKESIRQYALTSQKESLIRLGEFRQRFTSIIIVVEIR